MLDCVGFSVAMTVGGDFDTDFVKDGERALARTSLPMVHCTSASSSSAASRRSTLKRAPAMLEPAFMSMMGSRATPGMLLLMESAKAKWSLIAAPGCL